MQGLFLLLIAGNALAQEAALQARWRMLEPGAGEVGGWVARPQQGFDPTDLSWRYGLAPDWQLTGLGLAYRLWQGEQAEIQLIGQIVGFTYSELQGMSWEFAAGLQGSWEASSALACKLALERENRPGITLDRTQADLFWGKRDPWLLSASWRQRYYDHPWGDEVASETWAHLGLGRLWALPADWFFGDVGLQAWGGSDDPWLAAALVARFP